MAALLQLGLSAGLLGAVVGVGYLIMRGTTPKKEDLVQKMDPDLISSKAMSDQEKRNEQLFKILREAANSKEPVWRTTAKPMSSNRPPTDTPEKEIEIQTDKTK